MSIKLVPMEEPLVFEWTIIRTIKSIDEVDKDSWKTVVNICKVTL